MCLSGWKPIIHGNLLMCLSGWKPIIHGACGEAAACRDHTWGPGEVNLGRGEREKWEFGEGVNFWGWFLILLLKLSFLN